MSPYHRFTSDEHSVFFRPTFSSIGKPKFGSALKLLPSASARGRKNHRFSEQITKTIAAGNFHGTTDGWPTKFVVSEAGRQFHRSETCPRPRCNSSHAQWQRRSSSAAIVLGRRCFQWSPRSGKASFPPATQLVSASRLPRNGNVALLRRPSFSAADVSSGRPDRGKLRFPRPRNLPRQVVSPATVTSLFFGGRRFRPPMLPLAAPIAAT